MPSARMLWDAHLCCAWCCGLSSALQLTVRCRNTPAPPDKCALGLRYTLPPSSSPFSFILIAMACTLAAGSFISVMVASPSLTFLLLNHGLFHSERSWPHRQPFHDAVYWKELAWPVPLFWTYLAGHPPSGALSTPMWSRPRGASTFFSMHNTPYPSPVPSPYCTIWFSFF